MKNWSLIRQIVAQILRQQRYTNKGIGIFLRSQFKFDIDFISRAED